MKNTVVEFVNENEGLLHAYATDDINSARSSTHVETLRGEQHDPETKLPLDQMTYYPLSPSAEDFGYNPHDQTDPAKFQGPLKDAVLPDSSIAANRNEFGEMQWTTSIQLEKNRQEKSLELKFQSFQRHPNFDTFRPRFRSHFSSDATSAWPLRSIEESRLLQHFVQNLAPWVR